MPKMGPPEPKAEGVASAVQAATIRPMAAGLHEIVENKRREVREARAKHPLEEVRGRAGQAEPARDFFGTVTRAAAGGTAVIAEVKRRSPSAGLIRREYDGDGFDPGHIARRYHANGASAISCLTDEKFFGGSLGHLNRVKKAVPLPVLRKDFLIDEWQVWESRAAGADAVLLIAECLGDPELGDLASLGRGLGMTVLLEVHSAENLARVRAVAANDPARTLVGINNRNLQTMRTDLETTIRLVEGLDERSVVVSESGVSTADDLTRLRSVDVRIALVGEHLMRQEDPGLALAQLLGRPPV